MESRGNKHLRDICLDNTNSFQTRSSRNANLYREIYSKYDDIDNLPLEDNTQRIDMAKLKELVSSNKIEKEEKKVKEDLNILEQRRRRIDEQKLYDINEILEKAKYENNKLKDSNKTILKPKKDLLSTLESTELSLEEINEAKKVYEESVVKGEIEEKLTITREIKFKDLNTVDTADEKEDINISLLDTNSLSLDLFEDLKPTEDTITTKPIKDEGVEIKRIINNTKSDIYSSDTSDIDIIKSIPSNSANDFFTNSYNFSEKDFSDEDDDDFFDIPKKNGTLKIIFLILAIIIVVGVIVYFVINYGLGI